MKQLILFFCGLMLLQSSIAAVQFYDFSLYSVVNNSNARSSADEISYISWGYVNTNYIELSLLQSNEDGFIEFRMEPTDHVEVSLTEVNNDNQRFGFIFKSNGVATIQVEGNVVTTNPIDYNYSDVFKVLKCGNIIKFFKNGVRLYEYCGDNGVPALIHTTHVTTANNDRLTLVFETQISDCSGMVMMGVQGNQISPTIFQTDGLAGANQVFTPEELLIINVFDINENPIQQIKLRTNAQGRIPANHSVNAYLSDSYKLKIIRNINLSIPSDKKL